MEQLHEFDEGRKGYVSHRIRVGGSACRFSAWFDTAGTLTDAERRDACERQFPVTEKQRSELQRYGKHLIDEHIRRKARLAK